MSLPLWLATHRRNFPHHVYLITYGRGSSTAELQPIFSNKGIRILTLDFQKIDEVRIESAKLLL